MIVPPYGGGKEEDVAVKDGRIDLVHLVVLVLHRRLAGIGAVLRVLRVIALAIVDFEVFKPDKLRFAAERGAPVECLDEQAF